MSADTMHRDHVNYWLVIQAIESIAVVEVVTGSPVILDPDDEESSKHGFREVVVESVQHWAQEKQNRLKLSFAYFLRKCPDELANEALGQMQDRLMPNPKDEVKFLTWLWECLYPGESYEDIDISGVIEINDVLKTNPPHMG